MQLYALYWQEQFIPGDHLTKFTCNLFGAMSIKLVNKVSEMLTGFHRAHVDLNFYKSKHVYQGDKHCNIQQPHSKWHEVSANAVADIMIASNLLAKLIEGDTGHFHLFDLFRLDDAFAGFEWNVLSPSLSKPLQQCAIDFIGDWPSWRLGKLVSCVVSQTIQAGRAEDDNRVQPLDESIWASHDLLDSCLLENQCISFDGVQLDMDLVQQCVGLSDNVSSCRGGSSVGRFLLLFLTTFSSAGCSLRLVD